MSYLDGNEEQSSSELLGHHSCEVKGKQPHPVPQALRRGAGEFRDFPHFHLKRNCPQA